MAKQKKATDQSKSIRHEGKESTVLSAGYATFLADHLSRDLASEFPQMAGFSRHNLYRMRAFYLGYSRTDPFVAQPVRQLPAAVLKPLLGELNAERPATALTAIPWGQSGGN